MISHLQNKAEVYRDLMRHPGWELLRRAFPAEIKTKIHNADTKESFVYEATRAQAIADIFSHPAAVSNEARLEMERLSAAQAQPQEGGVAPDDNQK